MYINTFDARYSPVGGYQGRSPDRQVGKPPLKGPTRGS